MGQLRILLFGRLRAFDGDQPLTSLGSARDQAAWAYLLLNRQQPHPRARLAFSFWPDGTEAAARNRLRHALYVLRRALPPPPPDCPWLLADNEFVQWNPAAPLWLDVAEFEASVTAPPPPPGPDLRAWVAQVQAATSLYNADLLETVSDDWCYFERERLRRLLFAALDRLMAHATLPDESEQAIAAGQHLLSRDPVREETHRTLMGVYARLGDRASALRQFELCCQVLRRELDVGPMTETVALYHQILHSTERLPAGPLNLTLPNGYPLALFPAPLAPPPSLVLSHNPSTTAALVPPGSDLLVASRIESPAANGTGASPTREALLDEYAERLAALDTHWQQAQAGQGSFVLLSGDAHITLTRLLAAWIQRIRPVHMLTGRSSEIEQQVPYYPLVEALRSQLLGGDAQASLPWPTLSSVWRTELARLLPEIQARHPENAAPAPLEPLLERLRLFEALWQTFLALADRPTLLLLHDLHWADETTLAWLAYLQRRLREQHAPLLVLGTTQHEQPPPALTRLCRQLRHEGWASEIMLPRLSEATPVAISPIT
jgi:DNA-binding SARP family transcriptional activator